MSAALAPRTTRAGAKPTASEKASLILQRSCASGDPASTLTGECRERQGDSQLGPRPRIRLGATGDPLEHEADRAAESAMRMDGKTPAMSRLQRPLLLRRVAGKTAADTAPKSVVDTLRCPGAPLPRSVRDALEPGFGHDFGRVRVHTDAAAARSAREVSAAAYTVGERIVFASGRYAPERGAGRALIAHELAHVVQQSAIQSGGPLLQRKPDSDIDRIRDYLSYGLFDWAITDADAVAALTILRGLPRIRQAELISDKKYADRLRENLPPDRLSEFAEIERDAKSALPPEDALERVIDKLSYGLFDWAITDAEAVEALEILKGLSGEKLAVALNRIDYARLMDNLPPERRKELIDLLAQALGSAGTTETAEKQDPGVALRSLRFTTDHGVLKDNQKDWTASGKPYPEPEWSITPEGKERSGAISHRKDSNIGVELGLDVAPASAPTAPVEIKGESDVDFLSFQFSGSLNGGAGKRIPMVSAGKLPADTVTAVRDKYVQWKVRWGARERSIGRSGPFTLFVTIGDPRDPAAATYKRMEKAVELVGSSPTLDPHEVVKTIMFKWTRFNLDVRYANEWDLAGNMRTGAQCIDLVRFVQSVIGMVGAPGVANAVVVWAQPTSPWTAIESPWPHGGMSSGLIPPYPGQPDWHPALLDGDMRPNNFEAALVFTDSGLTRYYPGGVPAVMISADEVLRVFNCLGWIKGVGGGQYEIMAVPASYRAGHCRVGARHAW